MQIMCTYISCQDSSPDLLLTREKTGSASLVLVIAVINLQELYEYSSLSATVLRVRVLQDSTPAQLLAKTTHCTAIDITMPGPKLQYMLNTHILFCRGDLRLCRLASCAVSGVCTKLDANHRQASSNEGPGVRWRTSPPTEGHQGRNLTMGQ